MAPTGNPTPARILVLISGSGSNLQALIDSCNTDALPNASIVRVISDRKDAYGLKRAQENNIPTTYHGVLPYKKKYPDDSAEKKYEKARVAYDADLAQLVLADHPDIVVCAGFMRIVSPAFLNPLHESLVPIINLHPALHGDLVGAHCIKRAWDEFQAGERTKTGVMVHYVIAEVDMGVPIVQQEVGIEGCATLEELEGRIHGVEHGLIVEGTRRVVEKGREGKIQQPFRAISTAAVPQAASLGRSSTLSIPYPPPRHREEVEPAERSSAVHGLPPHRKGYPNPEATDGSYSTGSFPKAAGLVWSTTLPVWKRRHLAFDC
ncbi:Bifunctional purine biosynthetic protein ADE5,7 [Saxophila tyrrhenica]|uniref:Phosphoribosylglycinamide formyltransferase n=1 Tax=Saxophila tyrrhenica TaxID=1690608 RepID=A0AAV9PKV7_9PEZI|nr:Bifunctional purine biosynthetic protein ADE5,7 [Saxophila tyrrhenica]